MLVSFRARAESPPCEPSRLTGSSVAHGDVGVERDARLLVAIDACGEKPRATLLRDGVPVEAEILFGRTVRESWVSVRPRLLLEQKATYALSVDAGGQVSHLAFTTGDGQASLNNDKPTITVLSTQYVTSENDVGYATANFVLELRAKRPQRGGVFYVGRHPSPSAGFAFEADAVGFDDGTGIARVTVQAGVRVLDPKRCFAVTYEDVGGRVSETTEGTCATVAGNPPQESAAGCSVTARGSDTGRSGLVAAGLLAALASGLARRARAYVTESA